MILIEQGKMDFDTPVQEVLPEFAEIRVLEGWDGDKPKMRAPKGQATARHLATHTSGLEYEFWRGEVAEYLDKTKRPSILAGTKAAMFYPMMKGPPETRWGYGPSVDWRGPDGGEDQWPSALTPFGNRPRLVSVSLMSVPWSNASMARRSAPCRAGP